MNPHQLPLVLLVFITTAVVFAYGAQLGGVTINLLPKGSFSFKFHLQSRSGSMEAFDGSAIRYAGNNQNETPSLNVILESESLAYMTFFDSAHVHTFLKPIQDDGSASMALNNSTALSQCLHLHYDSPWTRMFGNVGLSQLLDSLVFERVKESISYDEQINEKCIRNNLGLYAFSVFEENMIMCVDEKQMLPRFVISENVVVSISDFSLDSSKKASDTNNEAAFFSRLEKLLGNCTYYDKVHVAAQIAKNEKLVNRGADNGPRIQLENTLNKITVARKYNLPVENLNNEKITTIVKAQPVNMASMWFLKEETCQMGHIRDLNTCAEYLIKSKTNNKPLCVFLHGAGEKEVAPPQKTFTKYWGNVQDYATQCGDVWFIKRDTKNNGWDTDELQRDYCATALLGSSNNSNIIQNTVVFTHSMGNLILAAAIKKGYCEFDLKTSEWYTIGAPFNGSKVSTKVISICSDYYYNTFPLNLKSIYGLIATLGGYCIKGTPNTFDSYITCEEGYCAKDGTCIHDLYDIVEPRDVGRMCGDSPIGLITHYSFLLEIVHLMTEYGAPSDGFVPFPSCKMLESKEFSDNGPSTDWYQSYANHAGK